MRENTNFNQVRVNYIFNPGGLGDNVCRLSALRHIAQRWEHLNALVWIPDCYAMLAEYILKDTPRIGVRPWSEMESKPKDHVDVLPGTPNPIRTHLMDQSFMWMADCLPTNSKERSYFPTTFKDVKVDHLELPSKYAILAPLYVDKNRMFPAEAQYNLALELESHNITPIFLGAPTYKVGKDEYYKVNGLFPPPGRFKQLDDLNILQAARVLAGATAVCGVDNGLLHLAACTQTKIVAGYTVIDWKYRVPTRHASWGWRWYAVTPDEDLPCRFCHTQMNFVTYKEKYAGCEYDDYKCLQSITADKFITGLRALEVM